MSTLDTTDGDWPDGAGLIGLLALGVLLSPVLLVGGLLAVSVLAVAALSAIETFGGVAVILGLLLPIAAWYFRSGREATPTEPDDPLEIARRRYARGEIGEAELERTVDRLLATEAVDAVARPPDDRRWDGRAGGPADGDRDASARQSSRSDDRRRERDDDRR